MQKEVWRCLGERLKAARSAKGLKQQEVAHRLKISQSWYQKVESGKVKVPPEMLKSLCALLGVNEQRFMKKLSKHDALVQATRSRNSSEIKSINSLVEMTAEEKNIVTLLHKEIIQKKALIVELGKHRNGFVHHEKEMLIAE